MYTYYTPVQLEQHGLFAYEIAKAFGIKSKNGEFHRNLVSAFFGYIDEKKKMHNLYYRTTNGLSRVFFPAQKDFEDFAAFLLSNAKLVSDDLVVIELKGKKYYILRETEIGRLGESQ